MSENKFLILLPMVMMVCANAIAMEDTMFGELVYDRVVQMRSAREKNPCNVEIVGVIVTVLMEVPETVFVEMPTKKLEAFYSKERLALIRAGESLVIPSELRYLHEESESIHREENPNIDSMELAYIRKMSLVNQDIGNTRTVIKSMLRIAPGMNEVNKRYDEGLRAVSE